MFTYTFHYRWYQSIGPSKFADAHENLQGEEMLILCMYIKFIIRTFSIFDNFSVPSTLSGELLLLLDCKCEGVELSIMSHRRSVKSKSIVMTAKFRSQHLCTWSVCVCRPRTTSSLSTFNATVSTHSIPLTVSESEAVRCAVDRSVLIAIG